MTRSGMKSSAKGFSAISRNSSCRLRLRWSSLALGLSVISPVTSFLALHISLTSTRNALGKRTVWLLPVENTLAVASMMGLLARWMGDECIYENIDTLRQISFEVCYPFRYRLRPAL